MNVVLRIIVSILALMVSCIMIYRLLNIWFLSIEYIYCVLRDIANVHRSDQEEKKSGVFYRAPLVALVYTTITLVSVNLIFFYESFFVCFIVTDSILSLLYYVGMYCKFHDHSQDYKRVVEANLSFTRLCYTPILFLLTVYCFLLAATGVHISEWSVFVQQYVDLYSRCEHFVIDFMVHSFFRLVASLGYKVISVLFVGYLLSLPKQLISYLILQLLSYAAESNSSYIKILNALRREKGKKKSKR